MNKSSERLPWGTLLYLGQRLLDLAFLHLGSDVDLTRSAQGSRKVFLGLLLRMISP
ncbi:hypothetical protein GRAN_4666 [Granulicella sibirica]|uniref:Uncharacterized protein n=1 Tax=Granulicella sibirica TaxID=2479048 RepID=A0A4Q0SWQ0_9BACT|nr:hypothetical protein GRAN_4666 [Granulicella sibirica]